MNKKEQRMAITRAFRAKLVETQGKEFSFDEDDVMLIFDFIKDICHDQIILYSMHILTVRLSTCREHFYKFGSPTSRKSWPASLNL